MYIFRQIVILALLGLIVTACNVAPSQSAYTHLLEMIPDTPETRASIYIDDYDVVREVYDVPNVPGPGDSDEVLAKYYDWIPSKEDLSDSNVPNWRFGSKAHFSDSPYETFLTRHSHYFDFDVRNIKQTIVAGEVKTGKVFTRRFDVTGGDFDPQDAATKLDSCDDCREYIQDQYGEIDYYSWGDPLSENMSMRFSPPSHDHRGRSGVVAVMDSYVVRTSDVDAMELIIDTSQDRVPSLADLGQYQVLADGMAKLGAYSMFLSSRTFDVEWYREWVRGKYGQKQDADALEAGIMSGGLLRPYVAYGTGAGYEGDGPYMALALVHSSSGDADGNVVLLRERINEGKSVAFKGELWSEIIDSVEIESDGVLLLAKVRGVLAGSSYEWASSVGDSLIVHE